MIRRAANRAASARALVAGSIVVALTALLATGVGGPPVRMWLGDLGPLLGASVALVAAAVRTHRSQGLQRWSWAAMTGALATAWCGEALWAWTELVRDRAVASPGLTDVFYLLFYPFALAALMLRPGRAGTSRVRTLLDGMLIAASCLALSAVAVLEPLFRLHASDPTSSLVTIAYPVGDLLLVTVLIMVMLRQPLRGGPVTLAAGLLVMGVADTAFAAMALADVTALSSVSDVAYVVSYLLIAEAALRDRAALGPEGAAPTERRLASNVPLLPALCALGVGVWLMVSANRDLTGVAAVSAVMALLLVRQLVVQRQNQRLLSEVLRHQSDLVRQAYHDPLTGLANRRLFTDRLAHAVHVHHRSLTPLTLLLVDIDDFKLVNDSSGHATGDETLQAVASRLELTTRRADTVARLGGDEFAVLMEGPVDPFAWTETFLMLLREPVPCTAGPVQISVSIGIVTLSADEPTITSDELLLRADTAMYRAKQSGKAQAVLYAAGEFADTLRALPAQRGPARISG